jgi:hypothetical protein
MRRTLRYALIAAAILASGAIGWALRGLWPPPGGLIQVWGPEFAARIRARSDVGCIQAWSTQVSASEPRVRGGSSVAQNSWPPCVQDLPAQRVLVLEDGRVLIILPAAWHLLVSPKDPISNTCWPVGDRTCLSYTEK